MDSMIIKALRRRRIMNGVIAVVAFIAAGCLVITKPTPEKQAYDTAKIATIAAIDFDFIELDKLQAARPHLEAAHAALGAASEAELDVAIGVYLDRYIDALDGDMDRVLVKEVVAAALDQVALRDPGAMQSRDVAIARAIVGGILDGIIAAEGADGTD